MTLSRKTVRILLALCISLLFMVAGYYFSSPLKTSIVNAGSTDTLLREYAAKDTDGDGLPDWQEALYASDPTNPHSLDATLTDGEAVRQGKVEPKFKSEPVPPTKVLPSDIPGNMPAEGSLTDRFAKEFFQKFMLSQHVGTTPSSEEVQKFVQDAIADLDLNTVRPAHFSKNDVSISGNGEEALTQYAVRMAQGVGASAGDATEDELSYLHNAIIDNDLTALSKIAHIAKAYKTAAEGMRQISAPQEIGDLHLELMNTAFSLGETIEDMAAFKEDPIRTFLGIEQYPVVGARFIRELAKLDAIFHTAGVSFMPGDAGYPFYGILEQAATAVHDLPAE